MNFIEACTILEIKPNATEEEAKSNYKRLAQKYHPDHANSTQECLDNTKIMAKINEACQVFTLEFKNKSRYWNPPGYYAAADLFEDLFKDLQNNKAEPLNCPTCKGPLRLTIHTKKTIIVEIDCVKCFKSFRIHSQTIY